MGQSRKLTLTDWTVANEKLMLRCGGNKSELAKRVKVSRTTVTNFFNEKPISESSFRKICSGLRLNWQEVSSKVLDSDSLSENQTSSEVPSDEKLIEKIKDRCRQHIMNRHSRIRLLNGDEIRVNQLYVDVWLLQKPEYRDFSTGESLLSNFDITQDRLALSKRIQRNPGFEIANSNSQLVILGKPGSGKTTFLKHLAVDWCLRKFQADKIAVLIELRQIRDQEWKLTKAISKELRLTEQAALDFLEQGKLLVLMDGLDEVPTDELRQKVQAQIKKVSEQYSHDNRFIMTCRTQIIGTVPSGFTSVEVADFSPEQVKYFVQNWFTASRQSEAEVIKQGERIQLAMINQPDLREIIATPVLLSLICVVLQDNGEIPKNRTNLYKRAINWLLSRWNDRKEIEDWEVGTEVYRKISIEDKVKLLTEIAARKFENPENFVLFEQDELVRQIVLKLQLANAREGLAVLKAIEAQHGLLIERADEWWSFSHLTFQEYFTVQWLTQLTPQKLAEQIANQQWQETIEQLVKSQQPADRLLRLLKQAIDKLVVQEPSIQEFLAWLLQKAGSFPINHATKPAVIRAFYYSLALNRIVTPDRTVDLTLNLSHTIEHDIEQVRAIDPNINLDLDLSRIIELTVSRNYVLDSPNAITFVIDLTIERSCSINGDPESLPSLTSCLRQLRKELPKSDGTQWASQLRKVMIEHRNIGHQWKFTKPQQQRLKRYYDLSRFLVDLINIKGAVSQECRTEIEEGLLLPWTELQRRQPYLYEKLKP